MHCEGKENIPEGGGLIVAANHRSYIDAVFCAANIRKQFAFMAKEELFKNKIFGAFIRALGAFPVARGSGDKSVFSEARLRIEQGDALLIFPEGTRSKEGTPLRPRLGISLIVEQTGANILPCTIVYEGKLRFRRRVTLKFHPVIMAKDLALDSKSPSSLRNGARTIMDSIISGLPSVIVDSDNKNKKEKR